MSQQIYLPFGGHIQRPLGATMRGAGGSLERCFDGDGNFKKGKRSNA